MQLYISSRFPSLQKSPEVHVGLYVTYAGSVWSAQTSAGVRSSWVEVAPPVVQRPETQRSGGVRVASHVSRVMGDWLGMHACTMAESKGSQAVGLLLQLLHLLWPTGKQKADGPISTQA